MSPYPASSECQDDSSGLQTQTFDICDVPVNSSEYLIQELVSETTPPRTATSSLNFVASIQNETTSINVMDSTLYPKADFTLTSSAKADQVHVPLQDNLTRSTASSAKVDMSTTDYFSSALQPSSSNICNSEVQDILQQFS